MPDKPPAEFFGEPFLCGSRNQLPAASPLLDGKDRWRVMPDGSRTCSFCGSLMEEDFVAICESYANGEPGFRFDPSTKDYKWYASRPGVSNASGGGIKFYAWHVDRAHADLQKRAETVTRAHRKFAADIEARFKPAPSAA